MSQIVHAGSRCVLIEPEYYKQFIAALDQAITTVCAEYEAGIMAPGKRVVRIGTIVTEETR
jgi:hypothetical protein